MSCKALRDSNPGPAFTALAVILRIIEMNSPSYRSTCTFVKIDNYSPDSIGIPCYDIIIDWHRMIIDSTEKTKKLRPSNAQYK